MFALASIIDTLFCEALRMVNGRHCWALNPWCGTTGSHIDHQHQTSSRASGQGERSVPAHPGGGSGGDENTFCEMKKGRGQT
jgi:hypothetical protein